MECLERFGSEWSEPLDSDRWRPADASEVMRFVQACFRVFPSGPMTNEEEANRDSFLRAMPLALKWIEANGGSIGFEVPRGTPGWISGDLIMDTQATLAPEYREWLHMTDAIDMVKSVGRLAEVLEESR